MVVEDCGPDPTLEAFVKDRFGSKVEYHRNKVRRGLFDNWNACIELCQTRWLSILHDDDYLDPEFVSNMQQLSAAAPGCSLYFGETIVVNELGTRAKRMNAPFSAPWRRVEIADFLHMNLIGFPGQLIRIDAANALGGFRPSSLFCGDWEMWVKLTARYGAAQIGRTVGFLRHHDDWGRGTNKVARSGKKQGLIIVQHKRTLAALRAKGLKARFDREKLLREHPQSTKFLIAYASCFPPRLLEYNFRLLARSKPPHRPYALFQWLAKTLGPGFIRMISRAWNALRRLVVVGKCLHLGAGPL
jgi:glycosyltransferase involved in cell wall biosynthesis